MKTGSNRRLVKCVRICYIGSRGCDLASFLGRTGYWGPFLQSPETSWTPFRSIIVALFAVKKTPTDEILYSKKPDSFPIKCDPADA